MKKHQTNQMGMKIEYIVAIEQWKNTPESKIIAKRIWEGKSIVPNDFDFQSDALRPLYEGGYTNGVLFLSKTCSLSYARIVFQNALSAVKYNAKALKQSKKPLFFPVQKGHFLVPLLIVEVYPGLENEKSDILTQQELAAYDDIDALIKDGYCHQVGIMVEYEQESTSPNSSQLTDPIQEPITNREWDKN